MFAWAWAAGIIVAGLLAAGGLYAVIVEGRTSGSVDLVFSLMFLRYWLQGNAKTAFSRPTS
jgi:hypothetical protein